MSHHPTTPATRSAHIRIVLADDHAMVRAGLRLLLDAEPDLLVVGEACDGAEALALALRLRPRVVIMDVVMPRTDGIQATRDITSARPEIAVLAITGFDGPEYVAQMLDAGARGFLVKGASPAVLVEAVRAVARGELVLPPEIAAHALLRSAARAQESAASRPLLSTREMDVLREATHGLPNKEIARQLNLSVRTVHTHLGNIFAKLGVNTRTEAVLLALRRGWVTLSERDAAPDNVAEPARSGPEA